ncbi:contractile injection system protein, VgrG/Pvc8 family [Reinekea marinisedimentorum]|uniref:Uncharacterized protein involved in type VI secretion and phage assembly n=1 Tax=Reinekea marinisedimentorum TaxID=230495 RepID=A0A4R3I958_9GAMM|nr:contractile injection system protein, VgrG/Pvc8 family [Reinekea marinisedimentorum]TCS41903.1 uncharacterized protein involved in type VI secretion and phage assembly [Reinekea marinisedimentorum]
MYQATSVRCQLASGHFSVIHIQGKEALSDCYEFSVTLKDQNRLIYAQNLIGERAQLSFHDNTGNLRSLTCDIQQAEQEGAQVSLLLRPCLARGQDLQQSRVFMYRSRVEIIEQLLSELGYGRWQIHWHSDVSEAVLPAVFVQANESQLAFFKRLVAELGCFFWFDSDGKEEQINFAADFAHTPFTAAIVSIEQTKREAMAGKDSPLTRTWQTVMPAASYQNHGRPAQPLKAVASNDPYQSPLALNEGAKAQAERQNQKHTLASSEQFFIQGSFPLIATGHSSAIPVYWSNDGFCDDLTCVAIEHEGQVYDAQNPELGLKYSNRASLLKRASGFAPTFPAMPELPLAFPAKIESADRYAYLDDRGQYQLRMGFSHNNTEHLNHTNASPAVERMVPFANANQELSTGWHFPLLDSSTVLVTLLNNDPNRPCIMGFASEFGQDGPVTSHNKHQGRIVTPSQNELTLDDELPNILLQTFDGQTKLELNAATSGQYIMLAAQYGLIKLTAGQYQRWIVQGNLIQKHGGAFLEKVKTNSNVAIDGNRHLQSAKQQIARSKANTTFSSEGDQHWQTKSQGITLRTEGAVTIKSQGSQLNKTSGGNYRLQAPNDITIAGTGSGTMTISNGTGGFQIDTAGNIKAFGNKVTLGGPSGVSFAGNVSYVMPGANAPVSGAAVEPIGVGQIEILELENIQHEGEAIQYERDKPDQVRTVKVKVTSESGAPVPDVQARFEGQSGFQAEGISNDDGFIEFEGVPYFEAGKVIYSDEEDLLMKSLAADLNRAFEKKQQRQVARCLQRCVDYKELKSIFDSKYGSIDSHFQANFKHPDTQDFIETLLLKCGWVDSLDNTEVFYSE